MAFPGYELRAGSPDRNDDYIWLSLIDRGDYFRITGVINIRGQKTQGEQDYENRTEGANPGPPIKRWVRTFAYGLLSRHLNRSFNDYGVLTGVRPVKIVHRLLDQGLDAASIRDRLEKEYLIKPEKARLLTEIAGCNHPFLLSADEAHRQVGIYIGIPFCPSRCYYCSFPGAVLKDYQRDATPYLGALLLEMNTVGDYLAGSGWKVQTIYLGGGTPTILNDTDLERIFSVLYRKYVSPATVEITVEAGRPDTLSPARLQQLQQAGVNRVCINPQSMHDETLRLIGRGHNAQMVIDAVGWARAAGIKHINMDLIVGLPGENREDVVDSAEKILQLKPDNITVHTLAVKRGSLMAEAEGKGNFQERIAAVEDGVSCCTGLIRQHGYHPYYLYRQKYMKAGLENTGYALPGSSCLYNIQMIEERQTIIGLGGGASSKFVNNSDWTLTSIHNPKDPASYIKSVEKLTACKVDKLRGLN